MGSIAVTTLSAPNPPPLALARPHPSSPRLGSYCGLAASPHLAVGLRPGELAASHNHYQGQRGLDLDRIEGRLARRGARLASGGCLVGAVFLFSRRCVVSRLLLRSSWCRPCVRCRWCRGCGVVGSRGVGRRRGARSCGSACGLGGCSGRRSVLVRGVARSGRSGRVGGSGRCRVRLRTRASAGVAVRRVAPARGPLFSAHCPDRCGGTLPAGPACGQQKLDPLRRDQPRGVFKRQRRLAKRGYANDQGLNQTSGIRQRVSAALLIIRHGANPLRSL